MPKLKWTAGLPVEFAGKVIHEGDQIEVTEKEAEALLASTTGWRRVAGKAGGKGAKRNG